MPVPNYWTWTKTTPQKKWFFWSNPYKMEVMITSLIEILQLPNLGHMLTSTIWFESRDKTLLVTSQSTIKTSWPLYWNIILRSPGAANFADIIKLLTMLTKKIFKNSKKVKRSVFSIYICIFWYSKICWFPIKKCWC